MVGCYEHELAAVVHVDCGPLWSCEDDLSMGYGELPRRLRDLVRRQRRVLYERGFPAPGGSEAWN